MTHDELLAEINFNDPYYSRHLMSALCAVVESHKPFLYPEDDKIYCDECNVKYPCPTIQAIEKELK